MRLYFALLIHLGLLLVGSRFLLTLLLLMETLESLSPLQ